MDTKFVFNSDIEKINFKEGTDINEVRGFMTDNSIYINLSANQWKHTTIDILIDRLSDSMIHEAIHCLINYIGTDYWVEDRICQLLAGQVELK